MHFSSEDQARISSAIAGAEASTSGEIFCVVSRRVSSYIDVSLGWAAAAALILPMGLIPLGFGPGWLPQLGGGWQAAHAANSSQDIANALGAYAMVQALVFVLVFLLTRIPTIRRWATPRNVRRDRVRRAALQQFLAHGVHVTRERTGVLIFAALDEHQVELIADEAIHAVVADDHWADTVAALLLEIGAGRPAAGFEAAIALCGQVLAQHFPPRDDNPNELPDHLILL